MQGTSYFKNSKYRELIQSQERELISRWPVPVKEHCIDTCLGTTVVFECGHNSLPPVLLLHGSGSNSSAWTGEISLYRNRFHLFAADIPGDPGLSSEHRGDLSGADYIEWVTEILDNLKLSRVSLAGVSLGGWLSAKWAAANPERTDSLMLVSASGFAQPRYSFLFKLIAYAFMGDFGLRRLQQKLFNSREIDPEVENWFRIMAKGYTPRREVPPLLTDSELSALSMTVTCIGGGADVMLNIPASMDRLKSLIPHVRCITVKDQGHALLNPVKYIFSPAEVEVDAS